MRIHYFAGILVCVSDHMPFPAAAELPWAYLSLAPHNNIGSHCDVCLCTRACAGMTLSIHWSVLSCRGALSSSPITKTYTHTYTHPCHGNPDNSSHGSRRGDCWELAACWLKCWATVPWQPSLNLLSTSSPLLLCCDSRHNGCCLWTCQAAKDTKMTESTFDIRSCHQKTRDKPSWQLC